MKSLAQPTAIFGALIALFSANSSRAEGDLDRPYSIQSLHHAKDLSCFQNPFEEICRTVGPGYNCAYQAFMVEGALPREELDQIFRIGLLGKLKFSSGSPKDSAALRVSNSTDLAFLFKGFKSSPGLPAGHFARLRTEMEAAISTQDPGKIKRIRGIYWTTLSNGNALLVLMKNTSFGVTEAGLLIFGTSD